MNNVKYFCFLLGGILCLNYVCSAKITSDTFVCPNGWTLHDVKCYKWGPNPVSYSDAEKRCADWASRLQMIKTLTENEYYKVNKSTGSNTRYWLGLQYDQTRMNLIWSDGSFLNYTDYENLESGSIANYLQNRRYSYQQNNCVFWNAYTGKWGSLSCSRELFHLCEKDAVCGEGRFGEDCSKLCYCHGESCDMDTGVCKYGCMLGWMGRTCSQRKQKATAVYYCLNKIKEGNIMVFVAHQRGIDYKQVRALDKGGNPVDTCTKAIFSNKGDGPSGKIALIIRHRKDGFKPSCGAQQISKDSVKWRFQFLEFPDTQSAYDVTYTVQCNFSNAESLDVSVDSYSMRSENQIQDLNKTNLRVSLDVVDPYTLKPLVMATLGKQVRLQMKLQNIKYVGVKGVSPYSCIVTSEDKAKSKPLLDKHGCREDGSQVAFSRGGNGTLWLSDIFEVFAFSGYNHVIISCRFHICVTNKDSLCRQSCGKKTRKRKRVKTAKKQRRKRSLTALLAGNDVAGTKIKIKYKDIHL